MVLAAPKNPPSTHRKTLLRCGCLRRHSQRPPCWLSALSHPPLPRLHLPSPFLPPTWTAPSLARHPPVQPSREGLCFVFMCESSFPDNSDFQDISALPPLYQHLFISTFSPLSWTQNLTPSFRTSPPSLPYISTVSAAVSPSPLSPCR